MKKLPIYRSWIVLTITLIAWVGCSKEEIQREIAVDIVTNGRWVVQEFKEGAQDITTDFAPYEFQFYENGTVSAISGSTIINGTWSANIDARTITASFPTPVATLQRLNDTWRITDSSSKEVEALAANPARAAFLRLVKK
jgi:PBP1b-binding outer membrane lipoprotein LpoB